MLEEVLKAFYFLLPAYLANAAPVIIAKLGWFEFLNRPIDGGLKLGKDYLFGETKTWRGLIIGTFVGTLTGFFQFLFYFRSSEGVGLQSPWFFIFHYTLYSSLLLGALMGFGIMAGDLIKSFVKRRFHIRSTDPFVPFDQLDYLGALFLVLLFFSIPAVHFYILLFLSPLLPIIANIFAYKCGWKKVWW